MKRLIALILIILAMLVVTTTAFAYCDCSAPPPPPPKASCCSSCGFSPCKCSSSCTPKLPKKTVYELQKGASIHHKPCCDAELYKVVRCNPDGLNVRRGPSKKYSLRDRLKNGAYVWVIEFDGKCDNWAYVEYGNDRYGYVMTSFIEPVEYDYDCD